MTWYESLLFGIALIVLWGMGIVMFQFPGGIYAVLLRKWAQLLLRWAEDNDWLYLTWTHARGWTPRGKITYYEMLQHEAQDPEKAIRTYAPWLVLINRFVALIWLAATFLFTVSFLQILLQGG